MEPFVRNACADTWPRAQIMDYLQSIIAANAVVNGLREELNILHAAEGMICTKNAPQKQKLPKKKLESTMTLGLLGIIPSVIIANGQVPCDPALVNDFIGHVIMNDLIFAAVGWVFDTMSYNRKAGAVTRRYDQETDACRIINHAAAEAHALLDGKIRTVTAQLSGAERTLDILHRANIIYPTFRDPCVVYAIWEHMDRRPEISFREAEDRAEKDRDLYKITNLLDAIRRSIESLKPYLNDIRFSMYNIHESMNRMGNALYKNISDLNSTIQKCAEMSRAEQSRIASAQTALLASIDQTVNTIENHQYLELLHNDTLRYGLF